MSDSSPEKTVSVNNPVSVTVSFSGGIFLPMRQPLPGDAELRKFPWGSKQAPLMSVMRDTGHGHSGPASRPENACFLYNGSDCLHKGAVVRLSSLSQKLHMNGCDGTDESQMWQVEGRGTLRPSELGGPWTQPPCKQEALSKYVPGQQGWGARNLNSDQCTHRALGGRSGGTFQWAARGGGAGMGHGGPAAME